MSECVGKYQLEVCGHDFDVPTFNPKEVITSSNDVLECTLNTLICMNEGGSKPTYRAFLQINEGGQISYQPGDTVSIYAHNDEADVSWILQRMNGDLQPDQVVMLKRSSAPHRPVRNGPPLDKPITSRLLIRHFLELHSLASRKTAKLLASCCINDEEKQILLKMSGRDGTKLYDDLIRNQSATVMDLLATFESCRPGLVTLLEVCPSLVARQYSLVGECNGASPQEISFAFSNVVFREDFSQESDTIDGVTFKRYMRHRGVATGYIHRLWEEKLVVGLTPRLYISLHPNLNAFAHPESVSDPLIMISAGTGIAPFVGFLQQRRRLKQQSPNTGESWLFFGCRDPNYDLLFADEFAGFLEDSTLSHICLSFSRFSGDLPSKLPELLRSKAIVPPCCRHVQDCIVSSLPRKPANNFAEELENLRIEDSVKSGVDIPAKMVQLVYEDRGHVRVCGDVRGMVRSVADAWQDIFARFKFVEEDDPKKAANSYFAQLCRERRYIEDVWL